MPADDIADLALRDLSRLLRQRRLSAREATRAHLDRIEAVNPVLNAVVTLDADRALEQAAAADRRAARGEPLPLLHGVPMTHKDTHDTAGMRTTKGSPRLRDHVPTVSSLIIQRLNGAGVITTGKTNVPEYAAGSHTVNPLFGTTTNPWDPARSVGGSSGGVAAVVAAGVQAAGDASDMGGSIRTPAAFANLTGLRPSQGRVPVWPADDPWTWLTRQGPIARDAEDAALLMRVIGDPRSPGPQRPAPGGDDDFGRPLAHDLRGVRIGWTPDFGLDVPIEAQVLEVLEVHVRVLEDLGARVEPAGPDLRDAAEVFRTTRAFEFAAAHGAAYVAEPGAFKRALGENIAAGLALTTADLHAATAARARLHAATSAFFAEYDLLATPAIGVEPFDAALEYPTRVAGRDMVDYLDWMTPATLVSATGLPCLSCPAGFTASGLPVGLQLVAPDGADLALLDAARALERATGHHLRRPDLP